MIKNQRNTCAFFGCAVKTRNYLLRLFAFSFFLIAFSDSFAQMGVSNTSITPHASSILELRSTTGGFLPPRMTTAERDAIPSPAPGLVIYNTTSNLLNFYNGSSWQISGTSGEPAINPVNTANKYWNGYKNFVALHSDSLTEGSTNLFYTAVRANLKLNISDTAAMLSNYRTSYQPIGSYATTAQNNLKVNISDTGAMLSNYRTSYQPIGSYATTAQNNSKLNTSDTAAMLANYQSAINTSSNNIATNANNIALKVNITDTAAMLDPYKQAFYNSSFDSSARAFYLTRFDGTQQSVIIPRGTLSGVEGIAVLSNSVTGNNVTINGDNGTNTTFSKADSRITSSDITKWNDKVNISDTAGMLSNYRTSYQPIGNYATTAQNNLKVNISDTAAMLSNYRTSYQPIGSYATTAQNNLKVNISDTAAMLSNYRTSYQPIGSYATTAQNNLKVNISDTAAMLSPYARTANISTEVTGITNTTANTSFTDNKSYWSRVLIADGFPVTGFLTGVRKGSAHTQRIQSESGERTFSRYWMDANTAWSPWIEYIQKDDFLLKGDLLAGTGVNTFAAFTAGANGTVLTADNTTATGLKWAVAQNIVTLGSDVVNNNATDNTMEDVTGLSFPVTAGITYRFSALIFYTSPVTSNGSRWSINGPASPTLLAYNSKYSFTSTIQTVINAVTYDFPASSNSNSAFTSGNICTIEGIIKPSSNGTVIIRFASENGGNAITAKAGSTLTWW